MKEYKIDQLVWAKYDNYPFWPSIVKKRFNNTDKLEVLFVGSDEKGVVIKNQIQEFTDDTFLKCTKGININTINTMNTLEKEQTFNLLLSIGIALQLQEHMFEYKNFQQFKEKGSEKECIGLAMSYINYSRTHNYDVDLGVLDEYFEQGKEGNDTIQSFVKNNNKKLNELKAFKEHCIINKNNIIKEKKFYQSKKDLIAFNQHLSKYLNKQFKDTMNKHLNEFGIYLNDYSIDNIRKIINQIREQIEGDIYKKYIYQNYKDLHTIFLIVCRSLMNQCNKDDINEILYYTEIKYDDFIKLIVDANTIKLKKTMSKENKENYRLFKSFLDSYTKYINLCFPHRDIKFIQKFCLDMIRLCINYSQEEKLGKKFNILIKEVQKYIEKEKIQVIRKIYNFPSFNKNT